MNVFVKILLFMVLNYSAWVTMHWLFPELVEYLGDELKKFMWVPDGTRLSLILTGLRMVCPFLLLRYGFGDTFMNMYVSGGLSMVHPVTYFATIIPICFPRMLGVDVSASGKIFLTMVSCAIASFLLISGEVGYEAFYNNFWFSFTRECGPLRRCFRLRKWFGAPGTDGVEEEDLEFSD